MKIIKKDIDAAYKFLKTDNETLILFKDKNVGNRVINRFLKRETELYFDSFDPYYDKKYLDVAYLLSGKRIINLDDLWTMIRDDIQEGYLESFINAG